MATGGRAARVADSLTVRNSAPAAGTASITPDPAYTNDTLTAAYAGFSDADGDTLAYHYAWTRMGGPVGTDSPTFDLSVGGNGSRGQTIAVTVTASDGNGGSANAADALAVSNSGPVAGSVALSPDPVGTNDVLTATPAGFTDADSEQLYYRYSWSLNGLELHGETRSYLNLAVYGDVGDTVEVSVFAVDTGGSGLSTAIVTEAITITNSAPTAGTVSISPDPAYTNDTLTATPAGFADGDGDTLSYHFVWTKNGSPVGADDPSLDLSVLLNGDKGDLIAVSVTASDGNGGTSGAATDGLTVLNSAPVAGTLAISPDPAYTNSNLTAGYSGFSDADGDTLIYSYRWRKNSGGTVGIASTLDLSVAGNGDRGDTLAVDVSAHDGSAGCGASDSIVVSNAAPVATDDSDTAAEDTAVTVAVLSNDGDVDGDALSVTGATDPPNGTAVDNGDGTITYTPDTGWGGIDSFDYTVSDGNGGSDTGTVSITVSSVNSDPVAVDDSGTTAEDTVLNVAAPGVLSNDTDGDSDPLSVTGSTDPPHGTAAVNADGSFTYTPDANYHGADSFDYTVSDGQGGTDTGTVSITVTSVNDPPVAHAEGPYNVQEGWGIFWPAPGVLTNDSDIDGPMPISAILVTGPQHAASFVFRADGYFDYVPESDWNGTDSFSYLVYDGDLSSGPVTISFNVTPVNDSPVAVDDAVTTDEDTPVIVDVVPNDTDVDGDTLHVTGITAAAHGIAVLNPDDSITYSPEQDYQGSDSVDYTISDGHGGTDTGTLAITVNAVNDPPVAVNDTATTAEGTPVTVDFLGNDTDVDGDTLTRLSSTAPAHGVLQLNPDGTVTYTPNAGYNGTDSWDYVVSDGQGGTDTGTVTVTVTSVSDPPVANQDGPLTVAEDGHLAASAPGVLGNDADLDSDPLTADLVSGTFHGALNLNADGSFTYDPGANYHGTDSFSYRAYDGALYSNTITVSINVTSVNDAPVANDDTATTAQDASVAISVLSNDTDAEGDTLSVTAATTPAHGAAVVNGDNTITYTPAAGYHGPDSFAYTASDGHGGADTANVSVTVAAAPPHPATIPIAGTGRHAVFREPHRDEHLLGGAGGCECSEAPEPELRHLGRHLLRHLYDGRVHR